jgi:SP family sugar:H+ symporter-like MFS transporter
MSGGMMQGPVAKVDGPVVVEPSRTGKVVAISIIAALGGFLFGYDSSVINGANQAVFHEFNITSAGFQGFIVAVALLGSAVGALVGGRLANSLGRKKVMLLAAILFLVAGIGQALPFSEWDFMFWRIIGGFAIGLAAVISPMYISEVAPAHLRGRLTSLFQFAIVIGIFATQLVNQILLAIAGGQTTGFPKSTDNYQAPVQANNEFWFGLQTWQWMFLCMVVPSIIYFLLASTLPESPRFLVSKGDYEGAKNTLKKIYTDDVNPRVETIKDSLDAEHVPSMKDVKGDKFGLQGIVWVGIILAVFQQFVGINAVFYYSNIVFQAVGFTTADAFQQSTLISAVNVIFTVVAIALIDRLGRKPLLIIGSCGMFVTLGMMSILFITAPKATAVDVAKSTLQGGSIALGEPALSSTSGWIAVVCLNLYVAFFAATWGPIVWVLLGEMFSNTIRAMAMSLGVAANWIANFIVSETFPVLVKASIGIAYGIFTICAFASIFYVWKYVTETKGAELEDMENLEGISRPKVS